MNFLITSPIRTFTIITTTQCELAESVYRDANASVLTHWLTSNSSNINNYMTLSSHEMRLVDSQSIQQMTSNICKSFYPGLSCMDNFPFLFLAILPPSSSNPMVTLMEKGTFKIINHHEIKVLHFRHSMSIKIHRIWAKYMHSGQIFQAEYIWNTEQ